jgi:biotin carboxylase
MNSFELVQAPDRVHAEMRRISRIVVMGFDVPRMAFARRCREAGLQVHLLDVVDRDRKFRRHCASVEAGGEVMMRDQIGRPEGLEQVRDYVRKVGAEALLTIDEFSLIWLARNRELFEPDCRLMAPEAAVLEHLLYKQEQTSLAREAGFHVLDTWLFQGPDDTDQVPDEAYPLCLRPTYPNTVTPMFKAEVVASREELRGFLGSFIAIKSPIIGQPFRVGPNLVVHGVRSEGGMLAMRGFLAYRKFRGLTLCLGETSIPPELEASCRKFAEMSSLVGPFHFELLRSDRDARTYFLEINARLGGTTAKAVRLGFDEPMLALASYGLATPRVPRPLVAHAATTGKRMLLKSIISNVLHGPGEIDYPQANRWSEIASMLGELAFTKEAVLSIRDLRGSLWYATRLGGG